MKFLNYRSNGKEYYAWALMETCVPVQIECIMLFKRKMAVIKKPSYPLWELALPFVR
jgi:hypothetical protein